MPVTVKCLICGVEESVIPARAKTYKCCSRECGGKWRAAHLAGEGSSHWQEGERSKVCEHCGTRFEKLPERAMSLFRRQKFCSKACADQGGLRHSGEANGNWNGNPRRKHRGKHAAWARKVISRDNATCQVCGISGVEVHAHHIKAYKDHPEQRWEVSNGQTVCHKCHWAIHSTEAAANGVNSVNTVAGQAAGNTEPSFGRKPVEGVTIRGRAYRRWEGNCENCGSPLSKRWSDVVGKAHIYCSHTCARTDFWRRWREAQGSNSSTSAPPETEEMIWTHGKP